MIWSKKGSRQREREAAPRWGVWEALHLHQEWKEEELWVPGGRALETEGTASTEEVDEHRECGGWGPGWHPAKPIGALWPPKDSGLTPGEMGATAGLEQQREVI